MEKKLIKKYWRLTVGFAFIYTGFSYMSTNLMWSKIDLLIGLYFVIWHAVSLLNITWRRNKQSDNKNYINK